MNKNLENLVDLLTNIHDTKIMMQFLEGLLTGKELEEISTRIQIIKYLKQGLSQREIAKKLGVGIATVTRGSKELQDNKFNEIDI